MIKIILSLNFVCHGKIRYPGILLLLINWNRVAMGRHGLFVASVAGRTSKSILGSDITEAIGG